MNKQFGFYKIHRNKLFGFTMIRWMSIGYIRLEDMLGGGTRTKKYEDWKPEMIRIAEKSLNENRMKNAAIYFRSAEFFTVPEEANKGFLYDEFVELFYQTSFSRVQFLLL